jgi:hypothetical protein
MRGRRRRRRAAMVVGLVGGESGECGQRPKGVLRRELPCGGRIGRLHGFVPWLESEISEEGE